MVKYRVDRKRLIDTSYIKDMCDYVLRSEKPKVVLSINPSLAHIKALLDYKGVYIISKKI